MLKLAIKLEGQREGERKTYFLDLAISVEVHLSVLCQYLTARGPTNQFCIYSEQHDQLFDQEYFEGKRLFPQRAIPCLLTTKTDIWAAAAIEKLAGNDGARKLAIYDIGARLIRQPFAKAFLKMNGVASIISTVLVSTGTTLAYALRALDAALTYGYGYDLLSSELITKVCHLLHTSQLNVQTAAIYIADHIATSQNKGLPILLAILESQQPSAPFAFVGPLLASDDLEARVGTLKLLTSLFENTKDRERLLAHFASSQVSQLIMTNCRRVQKLDQEIVIQTLRFQRLKDREGSFKSCEPLLEEIWNTAIPAKRYERISKEWQTVFGFSHTDPALDLGELGLAGVKHMGELIFLTSTAYLARLYAKDFKALIVRHQDRVKKGTASYSLFDVASAVSSRLLSQLGSDSYELNWLLFDHEYPFEEIFCIAVLAFERNWDSIQSTFISFPPLLEALLASLSEEFSSSESLLDLRTALGTKEDDKLAKNKIAKSFFKRIENLKKDKKPKNSNSQAQEERTRTRLLAAWNENDAKVLSELLSEGCIPANQLDPNGSTGVSLLHKAAAMGNVDLARLVIWKGANINATDLQKQTPLHLASSKGHFPLVFELLKAGADPARRTTTGVVAFHYVVSKLCVDEQERKLRMSLLPLLGDVNVENNMLETPLRIALSPSVAGPVDQELVRWLVGNRADVNHTNDQGETLLHSAIFAKHHNKVAILLECGADPAYVSTRRLTTGSEVARQTQDPAIMAMVMDPLNASTVLAKFQSARSDEALNTKKKLAEKTGPITTATKPWLFVLDHLYHLHNKILPSLLLEHPYLEEAVEWGRGQERVTALIQKMSSEIPVLQSLDELAPSEKRADFDTQRVAVQNQREFVIDSAIDNIFAEHLQSAIDERTFRQQTWAKQSSPPLASSPPTRAFSPPIRALSPPRAFSPPQRAFSPPQRAFSPPPLSSGLPTKPQAAARPNPLLAANLNFYSKPDQDTRPLSPTPPMKLSPTKPQPTQNPQQLAVHDPAWQRPGLVREDRPLSPTRGLSPLEAREPKPDIEDDPFLMDLDFKHKISDTVYVNIGSVPPAVTPAASRRPSEVERSRIQTMNFDGLMAATSELEQEDIFGLLMPSNRNLE